MKEGQRENSFNKCHYSACKSLPDDVKHPEVSTQLLRMGRLIFLKPWTVIVIWFLVSSQHRAGSRITFNFVLAAGPLWSTTFLPWSNLRSLFVLSQLCLFCHGISPGIDLDSLRSCFHECFSITVKEIHTIKVTSFHGQYQLCLEFKMEK